MSRFICIHGHFYQPPRENPWLEKVELQDSAYPYHDWNERITAECYGPNSASRIVDKDRCILDIVNNYSKISFNFGPTLLYWMEENEPEIYQAILEADKKSQSIFDGHGSAIAQAYNHMILPLANRRDKETQIIWGLKDFEYRFKRKAEGMWLPETAVDLESLELLAQQGIKFVILSPYQAHKIRKLGTNQWIDVTGGKIDPKRPYLCGLPSGLSIVIFFYDGPIAQDLAFSNLLSNGELFAKRLLGAFTEDKEDQLVHIATDGETYGHHHKFGDMALTYCLYYIESNKLAEITVYGDYLEKHPPQWQVMIYENSSWSCFHGVERWKDNCGCNSGLHPGWNQAWRKPLREGLDWLRDKAAELFDNKAKELFVDPWQVRNSYIEVVLNREQDKVDNFLTKYAPRSLNKEEKQIALKLLEMQRHAMLMYTSCGWFFDEISGIETIQIMLYAARVIQLVLDITGKNLEPDFLSFLEKAPSNIPEFGNGANVYRKFVKPNVVDLLRVGVHFAISSLFKDYEPESALYSYLQTNSDFQRRKLGKKILSSGRVHIRSQFTWEEADIKFALIYLGDHNIIVGVDFYLEDNFSQLQQELEKYFQEGDVSKVINLIEKSFSKQYSLWHLFRDEQREIVYKIFEDALNEMEDTFYHLYEDYAFFFAASEKINMPLPKVFSSVAEFVLNQSLLKELEKEKIDFQSLDNIISQMKQFSLKFDQYKTEFIIQRRITNLMKQFEQEEDKRELMNLIIKIIQISETLQLTPNLWEAQNIYFSLSKTWLPNLKESINLGEERRKKILDDFYNLGEYLKVKVS